MIGNNTGENVAYLERLSFFSLLSVAFSRLDLSEIYYIEQSKSAHRITQIFRTLGLISTTPTYFEFCFGDIKNENGGSVFYELIEDVSSACRFIEDRELATSKVLILAAELFDKRKLLLFFKKIIATEIYQPFITIRAVKWHSSNARQFNATAYIFSSKSLWDSYLAEYSQKHGLVFRSYGFYGRSSYFISRLTTFYKNFFIKLKGSFSRIKTILAGSGNGPDHRPKSKEVAKFAGSSTNQTIKQRLDKNALANNATVDRSESTTALGKPMIGALYAGRTITFDTDKRSEFFWLLGSELSPENVMVYFQQTHIPVTEQMARDIAGRQMKMVALSGAASQVPASVPTWTYKGDLRGYLRMISPMLPRILRHPKRFFYFSALSYFIFKYLYWLDFVKAHNIKINLDPTDFMEANIPLQQAIDDCGGVSVSYHWSNIHFVSIFMSNCADVLFSFGPTYRPALDSNQSLVKSYVYCGYITDHSFPAVRENAQKLRQRLMANGAKFIICFFDENSHEGRTSILTHDTTTATYKYFIERLIEDESLGLIFKPGYPKSIYERISPISDLIAKAQATGRCEFIDGGSHVSEKYPTEAAQASDIAVGLLMSGTVALESYLSGTPTVFLDLEKLYSDPVYMWGKGKVVFGSMDDLFAAIKQYRMSPSSSVGFGDLSKWIDGKDPYRDGQASVRMGQYLNFLLTEVSEGKEKQTAIENANNKYKSIWGSEMVQ